MMDRARRMRMEGGWALIWREIRRDNERAALRTPSIVARASSSRREALARAADRIRCGMVDEGWELIWRAIGRAQDRAAWPERQVRCGLVGAEGVTHGKD